MRPGDGPAFEPGEGHEIDDGAAINVGARDIDPALRALALDDFQHMLGAWRSNRNDHDPVGLELLQQRRGNMVDAAGDNDLVEGRLFLPAVVAIGVAGGDRPIFRVPPRDEAVIDGARALRQSADDLDRPY